MLDINYQKKMLDYFVVCAQDGRWEYYSCQAGQNATMDYRSFLQLRRELGTLLPISNGSDPIWIIY